MSTVFDFGKSLQEIIDYQTTMLQGVNTLMSIGQPQVGSSEKEEVYTEDKMTVYHYKPLAPSTTKTPVLITYALVNREYMMDLQQDRSFIRNMLAEGIEVYIINWGYPTADDKYTRLDDYIDVYMHNAVEAVKKHSGQKSVTLLGVCQGAAFSAIYASLYPENVKNLVAMVAPIDFYAGREKGLLFNWSKYMDVDKFVEVYGNIPGEILNFSFDMLQPINLMINKYTKMSSNFLNPAGAENFLRMEQWIGDSPDQNGETFRRFIKDCYQENKLIRGELEIGGRKVNLKNITMPVLNVFGQRDHIVPPESSRPLTHLVGSKDVEEAEFPVGHIGMYVSSKSQGMIAPKIIGWIRSHD